MTTTPTVLVVDDEPDILDLFRLWLKDDHEVRTAATGEDAISSLDERVDVVLLDRMLGDLTGDEVLDHIRAAGYPCRVAMVTAVEPDFDVLEMGFDDYLTKPVDAGQLRETVSSLVARVAYDADVQELFALSAKKAALEAAKPREELEASEQYHELTERVEAARRRANRTLERTGSFAAALHDI